MKMAAAAVDPMNAVPPTAIRAMAHAGSNSSDLLLSVTQLQKHLTISRTILS